ncbi:PLP-dependent aminotransferase family protein [Methylopila sp. M107]|uniref:aminotransferase-like domain-containing protein n=1 Tax=Methylopila sp. M107 TaxID=1101190 RepID=UPI00039D1B8A|nr:PLP-dependent aminotransferase family protein [Methylopila sp. M107]
MTTTRGDAWTPAIDPARRPLYLQIVEAIAADVRSGALREGDRLPTQRALAGAIGVDFTTVTRAYAEARRRNLLDAVTGRGSFVAPRRDPAAPPLDLSMNIPPAPKGLRLGELISRGVAEISARSNVDLLMSYHPGAGSAAERAAGAAWLKRTLGAIDPERVLVASGAQSAIAAILSSAAEPGDAVLCEPMVYPGLLSAAAQLRLEVVTVAADSEGMRLDALAEACQGRRPRVLYLNPTIGNPTTVTMPEKRRRAIASLADAHGLKILEDDPYSPLAPDAPPAFATIAPGLTFHVATVSKCLAPGLRTAFVVAPGPVERGRLAEALRAISLMAPPLMTALLSAWIRDGVADQLLAGVREEAAARQALARKSLPGAAAHPNGLHVWLPLPAHWDRRGLADQARAQGLAVTSSDAFRAGGPAAEAVRISLGAVPERARLAAALTTLAEILADGPKVLRDIV